MSNTAIPINPNLAQQSTDRSNNNYQVIGNHKGESVRVESDGKSLLASAAEEMSFMRAEKKSNDLSKRKVGDKMGMTNESAEKVNRYLQKAHELDQKKQLNPFLSNLFESSKQSPTQLAKNYFTDISQQYLALLFARQELTKLRRKKNNADLDALNETLETEISTLEQYHSAEIDSGINVSSVANETGFQTLGSLNQLRQLYRDAVLDYGGLSSTFEALLDKYEGQDIAISIRYLIKALGADISSEGPSIEKERLESIVNDIFKLQSLEGLNEESEELISQLERVFAPSNSPKSYELLRNLLKLMEKKWITPDQVISLCEELDYRELEIKIYFLTGFKELARTIPLKAFDDPYERDKLILVIQDALDESIELEEEGDGA